MTKTTQAERLALSNMERTIRWVMESGYTRKEALDIALRAVRLWPDAGTRR